VADEYRCTAELVECLSDSRCISVQVTECAFVFAVAREIESARPASVGPTMLS
jgi:hypothetical protein